MFFKIKNDEGLLFHIQHTTIHFYYCYFVIINTNTIKLEGCIILIGCFLDFRIVFALKLIASAIENIASVEKVCVTMTLKLMSSI